MKYLVISDIHGNLTALKTVLNAEKYDSVIVLGDVVDYGPDPLDCLNLLQDIKPEIWIRGNHDEAVARNVDCGCSMPYLYHLSVQSRKNITFKELDENSRKILGTKPIEVVVGKFSMLCVHGSPRNPLYEYFTEASEDLLRNQEGKFIEQEIVLVGHTHIQRTFKINHHVVVNPGSIGQPRDGDSRAAYAIIDPEEMMFELRRIKYDVDEVSRKLKEKLGDDSIPLIRILKEGKI